MRIFKLFLIAIFVTLMLMITGCSTVPIQNKPIIEQQSLLQKCTTDTPIPTNFVLDSNGNQVYNGKEVFRVLREWQTVYNDCAAQHDALVDTILKLNSMKEVTKN
ncbi:hypothetical protein [Yersinia phage fHe-Yen9-04]|uniref:O-spanin n=1 Tax=Yersinia phage fHe-Yen9-04 TaxID=2052742 RepID=A0A2C9CZI1_9CAUD|nr:hypothetical protein FDJ41_gp155 [Yersinia phage fHe-Yen9-04]SOK58432.1 hypothetical protein [Yersinia phage fHe-Yen9-04]VUE36201.1 hypothetical protein [Yersinia phage fHe-Yen9-04]